MEIIFFERVPERAKLARQALEGRYPLLESDVADLPLDELGVAIMAAGNSFGIMDGGLDKALADRLLWCEELVQRAILYDYAGELPVGCAVCACDAYQPTLVIYAPTMQVPMRLEHTANVYYAMLAALRAARAPYRTQYGAMVRIKGYFDRPHKITRLYVPLLGCGTGGLHPGDAAAQMLAAIEQERMRVDGKLPARMDWEHAMSLHARWHRLTGLVDVEEPQGKGAVDMGG